MDTIVIPISITTFDAKTFAQACEKLLKRNPVRILDGNNISPKTPEGYVKALELLRNEQAHPFTPMNNMAGLEHVFVGFMIFGTNITLLKSAVMFPVDKLRSYEDRSFDSGALVVTASVKEWHRIITLNISLTNTDTRFVLNQIQGYLEQAGFIELFSDYRKKQFDDMTYTLESKDH